MKRLIHLARCPYCRYHYMHCPARWNALSQEERSAIVAKRKCNN